MALRDCTESVSAHHAEAVAAAIGQRPEASVPDFTEMVAEHSLALSAHQALHRLPEPYREVFTLKTFCELSSKEIAALFGKSESWARVTAYRAKLMLLDAMKGECKE